MADHVRFDDLTPGRRSSFELVGQTDALIARRLDEVRAVVEAAERAAIGGAWVAGFVAYEAAPAFDATLEVRSTGVADPGTAPLAWFGVFTDKVEAPAPVATGTYELSDLTPSVSAADHHRAVESIRLSIADGDTYEANLTLRLRGTFQGDPLALYADLAMSQRGAHSSFMDIGETIVVSASPELFFSLSDGMLTTRPMKGTASRGRWVEEDLQHAEVLRGSAKERAENLMIVDLLRNDMGKISEFGTVRVDPLFELERYQT
ncbi:chorismate-binding protein, partial [bacterium]|nr:chorismate-binding protein [bacterium]